MKGVLKPLPLSVPIIVPELKSYILLREKGFEVKDRLFRYHGYLQDLFIVLLMTYVWPILHSWEVSAPVRVPKVFLHKLHSISESDPTALSASICITDLAQIFGVS